MTRTLRNIGILCVFICSTQTVIAQSNLNGISHEIGIIGGLVAFQSDYGERRDWPTNSGNVGVGIGLVHYINFAFRSDCRCHTKDTYWNDHFKIRNQISYHVTKLEHLSELADKPSLGGLQLRSMTGRTRVFELGTHVEWYPWNIKDFQDGQTKFSPYFGIGVHYVNFRPEASSSLGPLGNSVTTFPTFLNRIDTSQGSTFALVGDIGARYKLDDYGDLLISSAWHYYDSNFVDGLSPNNVNNKSFDFIWWLNVGYVYYF